MLTSNNNKINRESTSKYNSNDINGSTIRNKDCILNKTEPLANYLLRQNLEEKIKNVSRNKNRIPLAKTKNNAKKMSYIKEIPIYGEIYRKNKNKFQSSDNHKNMSIKNNTIINNSNKKRNNEIMKYIKESKQKNNNKLSRNRTLNYLPCGLSCSNHKSIKIVLNNKCI